MPIASTAMEAQTSCVVATAMTVPRVLLGGDMATDALGNSARTDRVANPDNLAFSARMRTLFIAEDSAAHVNNFLWAYNVDTGRLSRILWERKLDSAFLPHVEIPPIRSSTNPYPNSGLPFDFSFRYLR